jgi:hypothetical protein
MKIGDLWRPKWFSKDERSTWHVIVFIDNVDETVDLLETGQCRVYQTMSWLELELSWECVA